MYYLSIPTLIYFHDELDVFERGLAVAVFGMGCGLTWIVCLIGPTTIWVFCKVLNSEQRSRGKITKQRNGRFLTSLQPPPCLGLRYGMKPSGDSAAISQSYSHEQYQSWLPSNGRWCQWCFLSLWNYSIAPEILIVR